jgi:hypothetical protein
VAVVHKRGIAVQANIFNRSSIAKKTPPLFSQTFYENFCTNQ